MMGSCWMVSCLLFEMEVLQGNLPGGNRTHLQARWRARSACCEPFRRTHSLVCTSSHRDSCHDLQHHIWHTNPAPDIRLYTAYVTRSPHMVPTCLALVADQSSINHPSPPQSVPFIPPDLGTPLARLSCLALRLQPTTTARGRG